MNNHSRIEISVVMSVYNGDDFLEEAIDSILNQTFTDFEFIIINDASTDNTKEILEKYQDKRIKIIENSKNLGLTKSLNIGIKKSKGKYIARMDADDISLPERFEKQYDFMEQNGDISICGTNYTILKTYQKSKLPVINEDIRISIFMGSNPIAHPTVFLKKKTLIENSLFYDENVKYAQDFNLWINAFIVAKFANLPEELLQYRIHEQQITSQKSKQQQDVLKNGLIKLVQLFKQDLSNEEKNAYFSYIFNNKPKSKKEIFIIVKLIKHILIVNERKKILSHQKLKKELDLKLKYFTQRLVKDKKRYLFNILLVKKLGLKESFKILFKKKIVLFKQIK